MTLTEEKPVETCPEQTKTLDLVDKDIKNNRNYITYVQNFK